MLKESLRQAQRPGQGRLSGKKGCSFSQKR